MRGQTLPLIASPGMPSGNYSSALSQASALSSGVYSDSIVWHSSTLGGVDMRPAVTADLTL